MKTTLLRILALGALILCGLASLAQAGTPYPYIYRHSQFMPWHGAYADEEYREPIALVTPPTAGLQKQYHWGVGGSRVVPIYHQFSRPYPGGNVIVGDGFRQTPMWPSDTTQFGVYYIRGPW